MGIWLRLVWILCISWLFTSCATAPRGDLDHQSSPFLARTPIRATDAWPLSGDSSKRSTVPIALTTPTTSPTVMFPGVFIGSSPLHFLKNGDGSISVLSTGHPVSPLRGLDPALVNPPVLPFLFPSCDVSVSPVRVFH